MKIHRSLHIGPYFIYANELRCEFVEKKCHPKQGVSVASDKVVFFIFTRLNHFVFLSDMALCYINYYDPRLVNILPFLCAAAGPELGGPSPQEMMDQLDYCDLTNSCAPTPNLSPSPSLLGADSPQLAVRGLNSGTPERRRRGTVNATAEARVSRF